jgi:hypothetical protein
MQAIWEVLFERDGDGDSVEGEGWQRKNVGLQTSKGLGERRMTIDFLLFCFVFFVFFFFF